MEKLRVIIVTILKGIYEWIRVLSLEQKVGFVLLIPPLLSVFLFLTAQYHDDFRDTFWTGFSVAAYSGDDSGAGAGGYTSAVPIYLGLMAIAGAYLIKGNDKKNY